MGWPAQEVAALNTARIAGQSDEELRELVTRLHAARAVPTSSGHQDESLAWYRQDEKGPRGKVKRDP